VALPQAFFDAEFAQHGADTSCDYDVSTVYVAFNAVFMGVFGFSQVTSNVLNVRNGSIHVSGSS